jgi:hypothetical protein
MFAQHMSYRANPRFSRCQALLVEAIEAIKTYQEKDVEAVIIFDLAVVSVRSSPPGFLFRNSGPFVLPDLLRPGVLRCQQVSERSRS